MQVFNSSMKESCFAVSNDACMSLSGCPDCVVDPLVRQARCTRRSARDFSRTVERYSADMPRLLDAFHVAIEDFRGTAQRMRGAVQV